MYPEGAAARDGRLLAGDQILEVSGNDLRNATHDEAIQVSGYLHLVSYSKLLLYWNSTVTRSAIICYACYDHCTLHHMLLHSTSSRVVL